MKLPFERQEFVVNNRQDEIRAQVRRLGVSQALFLQAEPISFWELRDLTCDSIQILYIIVDPQPSAQAPDPDITVPWRREIAEGQAWGLFWYTVVEGRTFQEDHNSARSMGNESQERSRLPELSRLIFLTMMSTINQERPSAICTKETRSILAVAAKGSKIRVTYIVT